VVLMVLVLVLAGWLAGAHPTRRTSTTFKHTTTHP